jgi:hypothetical protein
VEGKQRLVRKGVPLPVIARSPSPGSDRLCDEAISFLQANVSRTYIAYLNRYDLDNIYITNVKVKREPDLKLAFLYL